MAIDVLCTIRPVLYHFHLTSHVTKSVLGHSQRKVGRMDVIAVCSSGIHAWFVSGEFVWASYVRAQHTPHQRSAHTNAAWKPSDAKCISIGNYKDSPSRHFESPLRSGRRDLVDGIAIPRGRHLRFLFVLLACGLLQQCLGHFDRLVVVAAARARAVVGVDQAFQLSVGCSQSHAGLLQFFLQLRQTVFWFFRRRRRRCSHGCCCSVDRRCRECCACRCR
mmetsp:Transcript_15099/g.41801  ORF Transcript_15099/g.41801 Transcript_15099/m.41801 type:complete len:220 (-) Transcript_15099:481-1140(-)